MSNPTSRQLSPRQIVAVLASLLALGAVGYGGFVLASRWRQTRRVREEIPQVLTAMRRHRDELGKAIEAYRGKFGYYPPLHLDSGMKRGEVTTLFYELIGTRHDEKGDWYVPNSKDPLNVAELEKQLHQRAFSNSLPFPNWPTNFLASFPLSTRETREGTDITGILFSDDAVPSDLFEQFSFTTWRYATEPASHNPGKYDLWIELEADGRHFTIGNWREVE